MSKLGVHLIRVISGQKEGGKGGLLGRVTELREVVC